MAVRTIADPLPLQEDTDGVLRIGGTRVTLDTVAVAFHEGLTAEQIAAQYSSLRLADVYAVIGYLLNHGEEVGAYLQRRQVEADAVRQENEARFDPNGVRDRLLARRPAGQ